MNVLFRYIAGLSLRIKGLAIVVLPLLLFLSTLAWMSHSTSAEEDATKSVQHTLRAQEAIERIEVLLDRATITAAMTGSDRGDAQRTAAAGAALSERLAPVLDQLEQELRDPQQKERLAQIRPAVGALVFRAETLGYDPVAFALAVDALRLELDVLRSRARALLATRLQNAHATRHAHMRVFSVLALLGVACTIAVALLLFAGIVRRVRALQDRAERLVQSDLRAAMPVKGDEIDALATSVDHAALLLADRQRRLEDLVARQFRTQEEERRRVAYDLHDGLAQVATSAHQHLQAYAGRFPPNDPNAAAALERGVDLVKTLVAETRAVIGGLRLGVLDDLGLAPAINAELEPFRREGRRVTLSGDLGMQRMPPVIETALFRIAQEALNNIRKHAGADAVVEVDLRRMDRDVTLTVQDHGVGFDMIEKRASMHDPGEHIGLEAIRERATLVGGTVRIHSKAGCGVRIDVTVPVQQPA